MVNPFLIPNTWHDYELLDSGDSLKRERWGEFILIRPEIQASWPRLHPETWKEWDGQFHPSSVNGRNNRLHSKLAYADKVQGVDGAQKLSVQKLLDASSTGATKQFAAEVEYQVVGRPRDRLRRAELEQPEGRAERERASQFGTKSNQYGTWQWKRPLPHSWSIKYRNLNFLIRPTSSKQVGIFPEQAINWDWCSEKINSAIGSGRSIRLLNLFGYTGAATIAAVAAGASVCHVDSSKPMVAWCAENARLSGFLSEEKKAPIRFIVDDCNKFLTRELRRKQQYDAIILDPPTFGRGDSGELWRLEDQLLHLLKQCSLLLSEQPLFLLMSGYSATLSAATLHSLFSEVFGNHPKSQIMAIPLGLQGTLDKKIIPCGISARVIFGQ